VDSFVGSSVSSLGLIGVGPDVPKSVGVGSADVEDSSVGSSVSKLCLTGVGPDDPGSAGVGCPEG